MDYEALLKANYDYLMDLCSKNRDVNTLCLSDEFWKDKIIYQVGESYLDGKTGNQSYFDYYISLFKKITFQGESPKGIKLKGSILVLPSNTLAEVVLYAINKLGLIIDGNFSVELKIGPYTMYSSQIADNWYGKLGNLGPIGYLIKDENLITKFPYLNDEIQLWDVIQDSIIEILPMNVRTQPRIKNSYIKLTAGVLLGSNKIK